MNTKALVTAGLLLGTLLPAQEAKPPEPGAKVEAKGSVGDWIQDLGSGRYKTRVEAENKLRAAGKDALPALRKAAQGDDSEIQWRARRLVRQIEAGDQGSGLQRRVDAGGRADQGAGEGAGGAAPATPDVRDLFDDMFRHLERDFGIDIPRGRFFRDDFFRDIDQQFQDLQQRMQAMQQQGEVGGTSQGMTMQIGPGGVHVEVEEKNDKGEIEKKVYDAPDLETFRQQYPDVLKGHGLGGGLQFWRSGGAPLLPLDLHGRIGRLPALRSAPHPQVAPAPDAPVAPPAAGERLGVYVRADIAPAVRDYLGLQPGTGVMVESVQEGTLAQDLGLEAGDIVTGIGGAPVGSPADIRAALGPIAAGAEVEVAFVRKGMAKTATAKKQAPAVPVDEKAAPAKGLEPRRSAGTIR